MTSDAYPRLADFMRSWFHQDFDVDGETVEDVVAGFRAVSDRESRDELVRETSHFLGNCSGNLDEEFESRFHPDVIPAALSGSTRAFLEGILRVLQTPPLN